MRTLKLWVWELALDTGVFTGAYWIAKYKGQDHVMFLFMALMALTYLRGINNAVRSNSKMLNANDKGWECPKCGRVYGPQVTECPKCSKGEWPPLEKK